MNSTAGFLLAQKPKVYKKYNQLITKKGLCMFSCKKGQVSVFIILGLLIVVTIALAVFFQEVSILKTSKEAPLIDSVSSLQEYVQTCMEQITDNESRVLAMQGGMFNSAFFLYYNQTKVAYSCVQMSGTTACFQSYLRKQDVEQSLANRINSELNNCVDLSLFEKQGFLVVAGEKNVAVTFAAEKILVQLHYPIALQKKEKSIQSDVFLATVTLPFGNLFDLSREIVNIESSKSVDIFSLMQGSPDVLIQRKKIYPDTLYILQKNGFSYQFVIQGKNTVVEGAPLNVGGNKVLSQGINGIENNAASLSLGCCYNSYDNSCFKNVQKEICDSKEGIYDGSLTCECERQNTIVQKAALQNTAQAIQIKSASQNCLEYHDENGKFVKGVKNNLESWCVYDHGFLSVAPVGSRSAVHYCYDAVEYVDECRDYREEFCVQKTKLFTDKKEMQVKETQAECKINRWQSCSSCVDQQCCEDVQSRDCIWEDLMTEKRCVPIVKPGFQFWNGNGLAVCLQANQKKECDGFTCSQQWVDDTAKLCAMQGDCGNYVNTAGIYTSQGYFQSDFFKKAGVVSVKDLQQKREGLLLGGILYGKETIDAHQGNGISYSQLLNYQAEIVSALLTYFDEMDKISIIDFLNPFREKPVLHVVDVSFCSVWDNPIVSDQCGKCMAFDGKSCSEYFCRSLGKSCVYDYNQGNPRCFAAVFSGVKPELQNVSISLPYSIVQSNFSVANVSFQNFVVNQELRPYDLVTLSLQTNTATVCKLDFTPLQKYNDAAAFYVGDSTYSLNHHLTLRVPVQIKVPEKVLDLFNFSTVQEMQQFLVEPKDVLAHYQQKYAHALALYKTYRGDDLSLQLNPIAEQLQGYFIQFDQAAALAKELIGLSFTKFDHNEYLLYLHCADQAGNELSNDYTVQFKIGNNSDDNRTATVLGFLPENGSSVSADAVAEKISLFTDKPATCHYDSVDRAYQNMSNSFLCNSGKYAYHSYGSGSYECNANIDLNVSQYYIRCADNPIMTKNYSFSILKNISFYSPAVSGIKPTIYLNITPDNKINFVLPMLLQGTVLFSVFDNPVLGFYTDEIEQCSLDDGFSHQINFTHCDRTEQPELGLYYCEEKVDLRQFSSDGAMNSSINAVVDGAMNNLSLGGKYHFAILCSAEIQKQHVQNESVVYTLKKSQPLSIVAISPQEEVHDASVAVSVVTSLSSSVSCTLRKELSLTGSFMDKKDETHFSSFVAVKKGYSVFIVSCKDGYGNSVEKEIGVVRS